MTTGAPPTSRAAGEREPHMADLLSKDEFRVALEEAIKGREAKNASFSKAWADGEVDV